MQIKLYKPLVIIVSLLILPTVACQNEQKGKDKKDKKSKELFAYARDWSRFPAIIERDTKNEIVAIGDIHGGFDRLVALLTKAGLIKADPQAKSGYAWTGGNRLLVCTGDMINKGNGSIAVLDLLMALEDQARAAGGELIVTLGNHEVTFLANPGAKKAEEFEDELEAKGIDPDSLPRGESPYGVWLMNRAYAARVNDWFFSHSGNTSDKTLDQLSQEFRAAVEKGDWKSLLGETSLLESEKWWKGQGGAKELLDKNLASVKARHFVFGHDPGAFEGFGAIQQDKDGRLVLIDVGMSPAVDYSKGALLFIETKDNESLATSVDADGNKKQIWRGDLVKAKALKLP
ncbi:MAG: metallophosphoesterase [Acidobacteriota bacterium]